MSRSFGTQEQAAGADDGDAATACHSAAPAHQAAIFFNDSVEREDRKSRGASDSAASGSAQEAASGAPWEPPDYMKDTYRTEDDESNDAAHRWGH